MTQLTLIIGLAVVFLLPAMARMSLEKDGATEVFRFDMQSLTIATAVGVISVWACLAGTEVGLLDRSLLILLGGLLSLGAWIDRISAWAPDTIILPFCIAIFLLSPEVDGLSSTLAAIGLGLALWICSILLWIIQDRFDIQAIPPADLVAIAAPFILFRVSYETAAVFALTSVFLLGALKSPRIASVFSVPEAVADGAADAALGERPAVTFLSVIFPIILASIVGQQLIRFIP